MKPRITTVYIDIPTLRESDELAQELGISRAEFVRRALRREIGYCKKHPVKQQNARKPMRMRTE